MKKKRTEKIVKYSIHNLPADKTDWKKVSAISEEKLAYNVMTDEDALMADDKFWETAKFVVPAGIDQEKITVEIDTDILKWLKHQGRGYRFRINNILRAFMIATETRHHKHSHH